MSTSSYRQVSETLSISLSLMRELDFYGFDISQATDGHRIYFNKNNHSFLASVRSNGVYLYKYLYIFGSKGITRMLSIPFLKLKTNLPFEDSLSSVLEKVMKLPPRIEDHSTDFKDYDLLLEDLKNVVKMDKIPDKITVYYRNLSLVVDFSNKKISNLKY